MYISGTNIMLLLSWLESLLIYCKTQVYSIALLAICTLCVLVHCNRKRVDLTNIPPGPKPMPIVGNFGAFLVPPCLWKFFAKPQQTRSKKGHLAFMTEQANLYGNIYSIFIGHKLVVILNGYEVIKDALTNHADVFSDRPDIPTIALMTKRKGIAFAPFGPVWRTQRKFCQASLRTFGLGKLSLEPHILECLAVVKEELLQHYRNSSDTGVDPTPLIRTAVSNVICSMSMGHNFHHDDEEFNTLLELMARGLEISISGPALLINILPALYYLPCGIFKELRQVQRDITAFLKKIITQHRATLDPSDPRDLIDMYLAKVLEQQAAGEEDSSFSEDYLFYIIGDLFIAGTDTSTNSILWMLLYMALHPDVQEKVQAEMDKVVGRARLPSMKDKGSLPFTEATIMEVERLTVAVPLGIPHMASKTAEFRGFTIPKGTVVIPNLWSVHRDPTVWEEPDTFNPGRFLDEAGKLLRSEHFIPFGIGPRICMGEQLAKMEMFLMFTNLLQAFQFSLPIGVPAPSMQGRFGLTLAPCPYTVCVIPR
ncbi:cytochrome P450 2U1 isoform X1 [Gadus macrocephalus]|uniref:cytochrome P450 2U1 isoform X1 n=1 Tax=Gadus macrocephalus TaxID=80720 RepID=UPI0028CB6A07|nr:cytochrome P450 2U1 isoform X1 [Gadus macrocephalus]